MNILESIEKYVLYLTIFLVPFAFLPAFPNPFETPKLLVLTGGVVLVLLLKGVRALSGNEPFEVSLGTFDLGIILLLASYILSGALRTPNKMEAFFLPGTVSLITAGALVYFLSNQLPEEDKNRLGLTMVFSGLTLSLFYLLSFSGVFLKIPQAPVFMKDPFFTPSGSLFSLSIFLALITPISISLILRQGQIIKKLFLGVTSLLILLTLILAVSSLLPGRPSSPTLPNWQASWAVTIETLKESPLLGMGPGNYLSAFSRFLPLTYNQTPLWAVRFTTGADFFLTAITEAGLLAAVAFGVLILSILRRINTLPRSIMKVGVAVSLCLTLVLLLLFPGTTAGTFSLFVFLALLTETRRVIPGTGTSRVAAVIVLVLIALGAIRTVKIIDAEITFGNAISAIAANDGNKTYNLMVATINKNPTVDRYHSVFAQINLAIARNMAQKKDLTDADRQNISQLIGQAVAEGKASVNLNPQRSGNWEILGRIYQAIMPLAQGADQFTIQAMTQAVALDPVNPNLRVSLGGIFYALGRYDEAIDSFKLATLAKPDFANAHYNLAIAYRDKGEIDKAIAEIKITLTLVQKDSQDEKVAKAELDNLESKKAQKKSAVGENLTPPPSAPKPVVVPPLTLPKEATPPASSNY